MSSIINNINIFLHQGYGILLLNAFIFVSNKSKGIILVGYSADG